MILFLIASCEDNNIISQVAVFDKPFRLQLGQRKILLNDELIIGFSEIIDDSRCPINLRCIWAGIGIIRISLSRDGTDLTEINLATSNSASALTQYNKTGNAYPTVDTLGYRITLLQLDPYPDTKMSYKISDHKALLNVSKLGNN